MGNIWVKASVNIIYDISCTIYDIFGNPHIVPFMKPYPMDPITETEDSHDPMIFECDKCSPANIIMSQCGSLDP